MSHSTNSDVNFCDICNLSFNSIKDFLKHILLGSHQKRSRICLWTYDETEMVSTPQPQPKPKSTPPPIGETMPALHKPKPKGPSAMVPQPMLEIMERVYDPEEDYSIFVPKMVLPELETRAKPPTVVSCGICGQAFKNDIGLQTNFNKHWREKEAPDNNFKNKSSFNQRQLYITKSDDSFIKDINEPIDYILDGFKTI